MQLHILAVDQITVPKNRQRSHFDEQLVQELAASISDNGLFHPILVRQEAGDNILVAGERRLRALDIVWGFGQPVRCNGHTLKEGQVPCLYLGEVDAIDAFEAELEENIRRTDLDWRERSSAVAQLAELRRLQAEKQGKPVPKLEEIAREVYDISPDASANSSITRVSEDIILAKNLDDPDIARAPSKKEAMKILKRKHSDRIHAAVGAAIDPVTLAQSHKLLTGNSLEVLPTLTTETYDVILTDPPYGINANEFGDGGGHQAPGGHKYDDSPETWISLVEGLAGHSFRLAKQQAHIYCFCDNDNFLILREVFTARGWKCFRTPLIWVNPTANKAPWPQTGPMRKWQAILYAKKGERPVTCLAGDVLVYPSDPNMGYHAQKPVALYAELVRRSVHSGDRVLDPFCGTGTIFPAAHQHKCTATGIDNSPIALGIAAKRLEGLK